MRESKPTLAPWAAVLLVVIASSVVYADIGGCTWPGCGGAAPGGSVAFEDITGGAIANTTADMRVGTNASLIATGTGIIEATRMIGASASFVNLETVAQAEINQLATINGATIDTGDWAQVELLSSGSPNLSVVNMSGRLDVSPDTVSGALVTEFETTTFIGSPLIGEFGGKWFFVTDGGTITLPEITNNGQHACFYATTAAALVLDPNITDEIVLDGVVSGVPGETITSASGAGDFVCFVTQDLGGNDLWYVTNKSGAWTAP